MKRFKSIAAIVLAVAGITIGALYISMATDPNFGGTGYLVAGSVLVTLGLAYLLKRMFQRTT